MDLQKRNEVEQAKAMKHNWGTTNPHLQSVLQSVADDLDDEEEKQKVLRDAGGEFSRGLKLNEEYKKILSKLTLKERKGIEGAFKIYTDTHDDIRDINHYVELLTKTMQQNIDEKDKARETLEKELLEEEEKEKESKKKTSKTKKPSTVTKPVGGGGSASVIVQVSAVSTPKPSKGEFEILNDEVQQFIKDLSSKKIENLTSMKGKIASIFEKLNPAQKAQLQIANERINGKIMSLQKSKCVSDEKIIEDTMKQAGGSNGKKFEAYLINKTIQTLTVDDGFKVLYDKRGIMNNESHPDLQVVATGQSYSLAEASMYDFSTPTHDIELKFYLEFSDDEPLPIPITKFLGSTIFKPYFRVVSGKVKLYNIWCEQLKDWVNKEFDKEILFVIMTKKGLVSYNYTDDLTISMNSSGWRKTPFDIQFNSEGKVDREGDELLRVNTSSYKDKVHRFGDDDKTCFMLPVDKLKNCYIKK
jgi:hypothetical protein